MLAEESADKKRTVIHLHRWVIWWFWLGVVGGIIALPNILFRDLTHVQERVLLLIGSLHWLLGGLVCWARESVTLEQEARKRNGAAISIAESREPDTNVLSELQEHQSRLVSPRHSSPREETLTAYLLHHWEHKHELHS